MEPSVLVDGLGGLLGLVVIATHHSGSLDKDLVLLAYLHLHARNGLANGAELPAGVRIETHRRISLAQSVAYHDVDAHGMQHLGDVVAEHSAGGGEEFAVLHANGFAQA